MKWNQREFDDRIFQIAERVHDGKATESDLLLHPLFFDLLPYYRAYFEGLK